MSSAPLVSHLQLQQQLLGGIDKVYAGHLARSCVSRKIDTSAARLHDNNNNTKFLADTNPNAMHDLVPYLHGADTVAYVTSYRRM